MATACVACCLLMEGRNSRPLECRPRDYVSVLSMFVLFVLLCASFPIVQRSTFDVPSSSLSSLTIIFSNCPLSIVGHLQSSLIFLLDPLTRLSTESTRYSAGYPDYPRRRLKSLYPTIEEADETPVCSLSPSEKRELCVQLLHLYQNFLIASNSSSC